MSFSQFAFGCLHNMNKSHKNSGCKQRSNPSLFCSKSMCWQEITSDHPVSQNFRSRFNANFKSITIILILILSLLFLKWKLMLFCGKKILWIYTFVFFISFHIGDSKKRSFKNGLHQRIKLATHDIKSCSVFEAEMKSNLRRICWLKRQLFHAIYPLCDATRRLCFLCQIKM